MTILTKPDIRVRIDRINALLRAAGQPELPFQARPMVFIDALIHAKNIGSAEVVAERANETMRKRAEQRAAGIDPNREPAQ